MRGSLFVSAAIVLVAAPRLLAGSISSFELGPQGGVTVPVMVNASGPFRMLLDTGATHSVISEEVAAVAGAKAVAKSTVITPAGETLRAVVSIDRLTVGPIAADQLLPSVVPARSFDPEGKIHGLIGQDVLASLRYTLDFKRRVVEWHDAAPPARGIRLTLAYEDGRFLVSLPQSDFTLRLVPDSGAGALVLFHRAGRPSRNVVDMGESAGLATAHANRPVRYVRLRELRLGSRTMRDVPAVTIERRDPLPAEGDGLLPLHLFERVTFDGPGRLLIVG